jgi:hypothetical protein
MNKVVSLQVDDALHFSVTAAPWIPAQMKIIPTMKTTIFLQGYNIDQLPCGEITSPCLTIGEVSSPKETYIVYLTPAMEQKKVPIQILEALIMDSGTQHSIQPIIGIHLIYKSIFKRPRKYDVKFYLIGCSMEENGCFPVLCTL